MVIGNCVTKSNQAVPIENFNDYDVSDFNNYNNKQLDSIPSQGSIPSVIEKSQNPLCCTTSGPMDSPWPMYCYDERHTGRSPYSTSSNPGFNKWWFKTDYGFFEGSGAIDKDGVIYVGSWNNNLYAFYPNGTIKWKYDIGGNIKDTGPAIDENGIIYVGTAYNTHSGDRLFAFYPNGTVKWTYFTEEEIFSSPVIDDDGTIYFGHNTEEYPWTGYITALYPNGTLKWRYKTNHKIYSDPAIGPDGTIYCGSHDNYLYALYPDNGTLKWKYKTGHWVRVSPCIGDDGTIYVVSLDNHLHAINPNGTLKWKTNMGNAGTSPTIGQDGTIYCGYKKLFAVNPINGSVKWTFDVGGTMRGGTPCNSIDGTIYVGTSDGGKIIAVNPDGTEKWQQSIGKCEFAPVIGEDGRVGGSVHIAKDITERKRAEQERKEHDRLKSEFVATVSHEVRTPLTIFKNIISNALAGVMGRLNPKLQKNLEMADKTIDRLARIIGEFLDISKIEAGKMRLHLAEFDIRSAISDAVKNLVLLADEKNIELKTYMWDCELLISADRDRIEQVLINLIGNAIKFAPDGGHINVRTKNLDTTVAVEIEDDGPGIERGDIEKIFDHFVQIEKQVGPGEHGTGLGLPIAKELVEMHGGRIEVKSELGCGTTFTVFLPLISQYSSLAALSCDNAEEKNR